MTQSLSNLALALGNKAVVASKAVVPQDNKKVPGAQFNKNLDNL
jgi:hypothetical protein